MGYASLLHKQGICRFYCKGFHYPEGALNLTTNLFVSAKLLKNTSLPVVYQSLMKTNFSLERLYFWRTGENSSSWQFWRFPCLILTKNIQTFQYPIQENPPPLMMNTILDLLWNFFSWRTERFPSLLLAKFGKELLMSMRKLGYQIRQFKNISRGFLAKKREHHVVNSVWIFSAEFISSLCRIVGHPSETDFCWNICQLCQYSSTTGRVTCIFCWLKKIWSGRYHLQLVPLMAPCSEFVFPPSSETLHNLIH